MTLLDRATPSISAFLVWVYFKPYCLENCHLYYFDECILHSEAAPGAAL
jgi:hypothetical protein